MVWWPHSVREFLPRDARLLVAVWLICAVAHCGGISVGLVDRARAADRDAAGTSGAGGGGSAPGVETLIGTFRTKPSVLALPPRSNSALAASRSMEDSFLREVGDRVFFGSGSAEIGARARAVLAAQAEWLMRQPQLRLTVEGHADDGGSTEQNVKLSAERATVVRDRLVAEGVEARRIATSARGREDRTAVCVEPACTAQNRRVVTIIYPVNWGPRLGADMPARDRTAVDQGTSSVEASRKSRVSR